MMRAADSVVLNIAEGQGRGHATQGARNRHYTIAMGSAAECAAALDLFEVYGVGHVDDGRNLVRRVGAMLQRLTDR